MNGNWIGCKEVATVLCNTAFAKGMRCYGVRSTKGSMAAGCIGCLTFGFWVMVGHESCVEKRRYKKRTSEILIPTYVSRNSFQIGARCE